MMRKFQAYSISHSPYAQAIPAILQAALDAADPRAAVRRVLARDGDRLSVGAFEWRASGGRLLLVAAGKAGAQMAAAVVDVAGDWIAAGEVVLKHAPPPNLLPETIQVTIGEHPVPGPGSLAGAQAIAGLLDGCQPGDLVLTLISGGGSALLTLPRAGISLADMQHLTGSLLASGASIGELNTIRKHLDQMKGGGLARMAAPAQVVTLILSDVIGSPLDMIASGPTVADPTTYMDALAILERYHLLEQAPASIVRVLQDGAAGRFPETLKPGDPTLAKASHLLVGSNAQAAQAAVDQAQALGFNADLLTTGLDGEARQAGADLARVLRMTARAQGWTSGAPPACLVAGGETTVTLRGAGQGGRNQELALSAAIELAGTQNVLLITLATDGEDGPTIAAGAAVTGETLARAAALGLDARQYLENNDSYAFFAALDDLLLPGPTGTNVNDLTFLFAF